MLKSLRIQHLALIDDLALEFGEGLNLLTGETGSGKSIIVDALGLILGRRASSEWIRAGSQSARVEAVIEDGSRPFLGHLEDAGIEVARDEPVVIRREIAGSGKSRAWINQSAVTVSFLQELGPFLADIHGQHDQQLLHQPGVQIDILDHFAEALPDRERVAAAWKEWERLQRDLEKSQISEVERQRRLDFLRFQTGEIEEGKLQADEEEELLRARTLLSHGEELQRLAREIYDSLYESEGSALSLVARALRNLDQLAAIDPSLIELRGPAQGARYGLEELAYRMRDYADAVDFDPGKLQRAEDRLEQIERLKRKYGGSVAAVLALAGQLRTEAAELENWDANQQFLHQEVAKAAESFETAARALSARRKQEAGRLQRAMESELKHLAMERSRFVVQVEPTQPGAKGTDSVDLLFSSNVGEPPRPLARIASGGELSRLMLALKTALHGRGADLLVFDEVDAGIGGRVAETVGLKLKKLAARRQVFCVTHLPQIAAFADVHFRVEKRVREGRTVVAVTRLQDQGKLEEVARMLAGAEIGKSALEHARELIVRATA
jgi:DNA repair protein RecN (Recombination protein N)